MFGLRGSWLQIQNKAPEAREDTGFYDWVSYPPGEPGGETWTHALGWGGGVWGDCGTDPLPQEAKLLSSADAKRAVQATGPYQ